MKLTSAGEDLRLLRDAVQNARLFSMELDGAGRIKDFCTLSEALTGLSKKDVLGTYVWDMLAVADERALLRDQIQGFLTHKNEFPAGFTDRWRTKAGANKVLSWSCLTRVAANLADSRIVCLGRDISEPEWPLATKLNSQARMTLEQLPAVMWTIDRNFQITSSYGYALKGLGLESQMLQGVSLFEYLHTNDPEHYSVSAHRRALSGETVVFESQRFGRYFYTTLEPLHDDAMAVVGVIGLGIDITDRKKTELELQQLAAQEHAARLEAERLSRIKDEFLITLSHELRTPMAPILGWVDILTNDALDADRTRSALNIIERCAKNELQLIDDLLDHSRIISGKITLDIKPTDISQVVINALETIRLAASSKDIRINVSTSTQPIVVNGDARRLQQAVWNLLGNAVKFTGRGGVIDVLIEVGDEGFVLTIRDNGVGIDADFLPFVFDRFRQADSSTTRRFGGLGLGLSLVKSIVESHGGSITATSPGVGLGATFTMTLPLKAAVLQMPPHSNINSGQRWLNEHSSSLDGVKVLVVEDTEDDRDVLCRLLQARNADVLAVSSVKEALHAVEAWHPKVIVSDIGLPGEDGLSFMKAVRALTTSDRLVPAIALTAYAGEQEERKAIEAGYQMHMAKPAELRHLLDVVSKLAKQGVQTGA